MPKGVYVRSEAHKEKLRAHLRSPEMQAKLDAGRRRPRSAEARAHDSAAKIMHGHARKRVEGKGGTKTYYVWAAMVQRCTNPNSKDWRLYGARGITVCDQWRDSFAAFLADMGEKPDGLSLDRIDNDGNYEPGNCRWATAVQQANNKRPRKGTA